MSLNVQTSIAFGLGVGAGAIVDNPALDYDFVNFSNLADTVKAGPTLDFTRAGLGTHGDSAGLIQTALANVARFDHDKDGNALGMLIEPTRKNLILDSEGVLGPWFKFGALATIVNNKIAPDGTMNADRISDGNTGGFQALQQNIPIGTVVDNYTYSVYCNKQAFDTFPEFQMLMTGGTAVSTAVQLDLNTGATAIRLDGGGTASVVVKELTNHWRICITALNIGGNNQIQIGILAAASNTTVGALNTNAIGGVDLWGHQLEQGPRVTSYIKTTTGQVTRAADALSADVSGRDFTRGTLFFAGRPRTTFGVDVVGQLDDGTENNRFRIDRDFNNLIHAIITVGGVEQANLNLGVVADNSRFKVVLTWTGPLATAVLDGGLVQAATVATIPPVNIWRGGSDTLGNELNGHLEAAQVWDARQSNVFLQSITS